MLDALLASGDFRFLSHDERWEPCVYSYGLGTAGDISCPRSDPSIVDRLRKAIDLHTGSKRSRARAAGQDPSDGPSECPPAPRTHTQTLHRRRDRNSDALAELACLFSI